MEDKEILKRLINYLNGYELKVKLNEMVTDDISIAKLTQGEILVNTQARSTLGIIFTIAHLFGHYIQFGDFDKYSHLVAIVKQEPKPLKLKNSFKNEFFNYEMEAFKIGKMLMQEVCDFNDRLERSYQIYFETDFAIFWDFLTTGKEVDSTEFNLIYEKLLINDKKFRIPFTPVEFSRERIDMHNVFLVVH